MPASKEKTVDGVKYYSMSTAAKLLGTTTTKLKQIMEAEGISWTNFQVNGRIWVEAESLLRCLRRKDIAK